MKSRAGRRFAVAVCVREQHAVLAGPAGNTLLGRIARIAVDAVSAGE